MKKALICGISGQGGAYLARLLILLAEEQRLELTETLEGPARIGDFGASRRSLCVKETG